VTGAVAAAIGVHELSKHNKDENKDYKATH